MVQKAVILFALLIPIRPALALDVGLYRELLERYTIEVNDTAGTRVDYEGLQRSTDWARLIASLDRSRPEELRTRPEKLAHWINVYNILAIDLVQRNYPVSSIRDLGSFLRPVWKRQAGRVSLTRRARVGATGMRRTRIRSLHGCAVLRGHAGSRARSRSV